MRKLMSRLNPSTCAVIGGLTILGLFKISEAAGVIAAIGLMVAAPAVAVVFVMSGRKT